MVVKCGWGKIITHNIDIGVITLKTNKLDIY